MNNTYFSHVNGTNICFLSSSLFSITLHIQNKTLQKSLKMSVKAKQNVQEERRHET